MRVESLVGTVFAVWGLVVFAAVPQFKGTPEPVGTTGLKVKSLQGGKSVQAITPQGRRFIWSRGTERERIETHFNPRDIWMLHERGGQWKDRKGNEFIIATPTAYCPVFDGDHASRENIEKGMAESAEEFATITDEVLARWAGDFLGKELEASALSKFEFASAAVEEARLLDSGKGTRLGVFFKTKARTWHYAGFVLVQEAKSGEVSGFMRRFLSGIALEKAKPKAGKETGIVMEGGWMTKEAFGYRFKTDLSKSQGLAFIDQCGRLMEAMQAAYRRYVPPQKELGISTVRVFATREGYNEYMKNATGEEGDRSIGLWSPSHEELLILDRGNSERSETLKTMRHEAFHQYLFYATGRGNHATWFNEGHAGFFENVNYDRRKNYVRITDDPNDRRPKAVAQDPERFAKLAKEILRLDHVAFMSGDLREVNDRYAAAWAVVYFLEKGAPSLKEFADYRAVLPTYLKATAEGKDPLEATDLAWECVKGRDFVADFLRFWGKRGAALKYEPSPQTP